jgi:ribosomal-protein-alanine N-acetyltransferase
MAEPSLRLRPVAEDDLVLLQRMGSDPDFFGPNWNGFRDPHIPARRYAEDGYLGRDNSWLVVDLAPHGEPVALLNWRSGAYGNAGPYWEIGIIVVPEWRRKGIGWRAQAMLCSYLFWHTPVQRIQAGTQPENIGEQKALAKAGFQFEGVIRACEFRAGQWHDGLLYSRLRTDPDPLAG